MLGGPCVGKGTHCKDLAKKTPPYVHISVGDLLRAEAKKFAEEKASIEGAMEAGGLVSNEKVQAVLEKHIAEHLAGGMRHFLLDGFPRSVEQAREFWRRGWRVDGVVHLHASEEVMRTRMLRRAGVENRVDDKVEIHAKRLEDFSKQLPDIIEFYRGKAKYKEVDCDRDFDVVYPELRELVSALFTAEYGWNLKV
ncbi:MAG: hypothetical protein Q9195_002531 [Heterodermia aff. obscurata]